MASIEREKREQRSRTALSKGKGKERTSSLEPEMLDVRINELPDKFLGPKGFDVARRLMELGKDNVGKASGREQDARIMVRVDVNQYDTER